MTTVIDVHAHYVSPKLVKLVSEGAFYPEVQVKREEKKEKNDGKGGFALSFPGHTTRPFFEKMTEIGNNRRKRMEELSIDMEILSTWADIYGYELPREVAKKYHVAINETLAEDLKDCQEEKFRFVATVPLPWGEEAASVLEHAIVRLGVVGSMIGTNVAGANLDDPRLDPFWKKSEELDSPVILHPLGVSGRERLKSYYLENLLGYPFETAIAAASLIFGGVLDRYPKLKIVLLHGGGYFTHGVGRLDQGYLVRAETKSSSKSSPSSYLERFAYDSIVYDRRELESLIEIVGSDSILLGTDYPFDMEPKNPVEIVKSVLGESTEALLQENTKRVFTRL